jgi:hypothetical protein
MVILKEEINASTAQVIDLAKWKLLAVSAVAVAGLGWSDVKPDDNTSAVVLLCSIAWLCAYVDLLIYRRLASLHAVARYLRGYNGDDPETRELSSYELEVKKRRDAGEFWISEELAHFLSSLVFSLSLPAMAYLRYRKDFQEDFAVIPIIGLALVITLFFSYNKARHVLLR